MAIIHTVLQRHLFNSKESSSTISEEFQVAPKKLYEGLTGKRYDPGQKLTKVEKAAREAAKVTPSTTSATPSTTSAISSTPLTTPGQEEHQPTAEIDPEMPSLEDITTPKKRLRFKAPDSIPPQNIFKNNSIVRTIISDLMNMNVENEVPTTKEL